MVNDLFLNVVTGTVVICSFEVQSTTETYIVHLLCFDVVRYASPHPVTSVARATLSASHIKRMFKNGIAVCIVSLCCIKSTCLPHSTYIWITSRPINSPEGLHFLLVFIKFLSSKTVSFTDYFFPFSAFRPLLLWNNVHTLFYKQWLISVTNTVT